MSKKSRKRNKKILGILAAGLGAAALMKRRKAGEMSGNVTIPDSQKEGFKSNWITKKSVPDVLPESKVVVPPVHGGGGIHHGKPKTLYLEKRARAHLPKGPPGWDNPYKAPINPGSGRINWRGKKGGSAYKSGGRVTGIAKRGFGRALMKGKK